ncbi:hypothetical protein JCM8202_001949 [Rhodotorula sphaerocarpa]
MDSITRPEPLGKRCLPQYVVLDNAAGQNPCQLARSLIDRCDSSAWEYYPLGPLDLKSGRTHYPIPGAEQVSPCLCSMSVYNLVQACAACQQDAAYNSTLWLEWVSNCTYSMVDAGRTFPMPYPSDTSVPDWVSINSAGGGLSVGKIYQHITSSNETQFVSAVATASTPATSTRTTETTAGDAFPQQTNGDYGTGGNQMDGSSDARSDAIAAAAVACAFVAGLFVAMFVYFRRRRRRLRLRGLGDRAAATVDSDEEDDDDDDDDERRDVVTAQLMSERFTASATRSVASLDRSSRGMQSSRQSYTTNSVSTGLPVPLFGARARPYSVSTRSYSNPPSRATSFISGSTSSLPTGDNISISPFSDLNRPAPSVLATRDNIHSGSPFDRTYSSFSLTPSTMAPSIPFDEDRTSIATRSERAPSSVGAIWGRESYADSESAVDFGTSDEASRPVPPAP